MRVFLVVEIRFVVFFLVADAFAFLDTVLLVVAFFFVEAVFELVADLLEAVRNPRPDDSGVDGVIRREIDERLIG